MMPELEYTRETKSGMKTTPITWDEAFKVVPPICPECHVRCSRSPTGIVDLHTGQSGGQWNGEFYCHKCRKTIGIIHYKRKAS